MQNISSKDNNLIKHIIKLKNKKYRNEYNEYIVEGVKLVKEAIEGHKKIKNIVIEKEIWQNELFKKNLQNNLLEDNCVLVTNQVFKAISDVETPQGVLAIIEKDTNNNKIDFSKDIILALDNIQDPGNLGTIIRTADSVGLTQILVSNETTDCYSSKVIRSTMGALFRVKIIECENLIEILKKAKQNHYKIMATSLNSNKSIYDIDLNKNFIVMRK